MTKWVLRVKIVGDNPELKELYQKQIDKHMDMILDNEFPDSGFDVYCSETWRGGLTKLVDTGIQCSLYKIGREHAGGRWSIPSAYYMYARSSIYKTGYRLANNVGIIDSGYRGNLKAAMDCIHENSVLEKGKRYWQLCTPTLEPFNEILLVDELDNTKRGDGGHGSTGK
jgi:dUTP pyrophosphatase